MAKIEKELTSFIFMKTESTFNNAPVKFAHEPFVPKDEMYGTEGGIVKSSVSIYSRDEREAIIPLEEIKKELDGGWTDWNSPEPSTILSYDDDSIPIPEDHNLWNEGFEYRKCFNLNCQSEIGFGDFRMRNSTKISKEDLEKIWKSLYVQLYCCSCFRKKEKDKNCFDKLLKKRERLLNKAYRLNEKFGFLVD